MKVTTLPFFLFFLLLGMTVASAQIPFPMVLSGEVIVDGERLPYQQIEIENIDLDHTWYVTADDNGIFVVDMSSLRTDQGQTTTPGQDLRVRACPRSITGCEQTVSFNAGYAPIELDLDIQSDKDTVANPNVPVIVIDDEPDEPHECPAVPVSDEPVEDTDDDTGFANVLIPLATGAGALILGDLLGRKRTQGVMKGLYPKVYVRTGTVKGQPALLHMHPGIQGYHDPATRHRDKDDRHDKNELNPLYEKDERGKYVYVPKDQRETSQ